jgi:uncharacterized membrane protein (UPF0182 family)
VDPHSGGFGDAFDSIKREIDPASLKRIGQTGLVLVLLVFAFLIGMSAITPWADYQWFLHDVRYPKVFELTYSIRGTLFMVSFVVGWIFIYFNVRKAFRLTLIFIEGPSSHGRRIVTNAIGFLQVKGAGIIRFVAPVLAFMSAADFSNEVGTYLLASHPQKFGILDPTYGLDIGFFVFTLPWYRALANFVCALLILTTVTTIGVYAGLQVMAALAKVELGRPAVRKHIHILLALTILAYAFQLYLSTYEAGFVANQQFTGAGLSDSVAISIQKILAVAAVLLGVITLVNGWVGKAFRWPISGGIAFFVLYAVGVGMVPAAIQRFFVDSNRLEREAPYAKKAIEMTRFAYGLDKIQVKAQNPTDQPTPAEVTESKATLDNMRLWDPTVLQNCLEVLQGIRPYYRFYDVDVDRYTLDGKETLLMLSPRQMNLAGLLPNAQNWTSERLLYTHGYGVAVSRVDQSTGDGEPVLLDDDIPQKSIPALQVGEPRIYFGDQHDDSNQLIDDYAIVNTTQKEFDYPTSDSDVQTRWSGDRGIPVGSLLGRLLFSVVLGDVNVLTSSSIGPESRLLLHRNIVERATRLYPFLKFDSDPYIVIRNGKICWILDGYTESNMVPYSAFSDFGPNTVNYVRNSVKVVVDAYTGELTAYSVDDSEPILKAWREIYPNLIQPQSAMPTDLAAHLRYPEDLLSLQSDELCFYHVENPSVFLGNGDIWSIAKQRGLRGDREPIQPFYVEMKLPDSPKAEFVQILPFSPNGRPTMTGWLAAHCDPGTYGNLTLYRLNQSNPIPGPEQIEGSFSTTPEIANINKQFQNQNSSIVVGNLLVIPIGNSFMYAESLFLKSNTQDLQSVPRLTKVILAVKGRTPVVKDTYREALASLFGTQPEVPTPPTVGSNSVQPTPPPPTGTSVVRMNQVRQVLGDLDKADAALKQGDFAGYGALEKKARSELKTLTTQSAEKSK